MSTTRPNLWTLSGINSWSDERGEYEDYVGVFLLAHKLGRRPARRYVSRLGTTSHYPRERKVMGFGARGKLDREARALAQGEGDPPAVEPGLFRGKTVKVLLVAPKTNTPPPRAAGLTVDIYWAPFDSIPNQRLFSSRRWMAYKRGSGRVWPVSNPSGRGLSRGHNFEGFMRPDRKILRRVRRRRPGHKQIRYVWMPSGEMAPHALEVLRGWMDDPKNDYVLVAHSQGTNIAMQLLKRGYADAKTS